MHVVEGGNYSAEYRRDTKATSPGLNAEPGETEDDSLDDDEIGAPDTPDAPRQDWKANMPGCSDHAIANRDPRDDHFANDYCDHSLPDRQADCNEGCTKLPVAQGNLIDGPE